MKFNVCIVVIAVLSCSAIAKGYSKPARFQNLPYYQQPTEAPRLMRLPRAALDGKLMSNPNGGADARLELTQGIGNKDDNAIASVFVAGNTMKGPVTTGGALGFNLNGHGVALTKEHIPGVRDSFTQSAHANLFNDGVNKINANVFKSQNSLPNGFEFERNGGGLSWASQSGHGAAASISSIPDFGRQLELAGKANLWSSSDKNTRLDLNAGASQWLSGPFSGQRNFGGNLGLTHMFG